MDSQTGSGRRRSSGGLSTSASIQSVVSGIQKQISRISVTNPQDKEKILEDTDDDVHQPAYKSIETQSFKIRDKDKILEDTDDDVHQPTYKSIDSDSQIASTYNCTDLDDIQTSITSYASTASTVSYEGDNCCVFCLDGGDLIHMCKCIVMAHKNCALDYIRFPGSMNGKCCQCRRTLEYKIVDGHTAMKNKYIIAFWSILFGYIAMIGLSIYLTILMIPSESMDPHLYGFLVANLSILWPLIIIYIVHYWLENKYGPKNRTESAKSDTWLSGFYGGSCDCSDGGDELGICLLILCFIIILFVQIAAAIYMIKSVYRHYTSFVLKSKKKIKFKHEKRALNTSAYVNEKCIV